MLKKTIELPHFVNQIKSFQKKYPKEKDYFKEVINSLSPDKGDLMPGFRNLPTYKLRVPLKKYNISKRNGLRIIFIDYKNFIIPVAIYSHSDYKQKSEFLFIKEQYRKTLDGIKTRFKKEKDE